MTQLNPVIDDKYEILKLIGKGGMSKVYLAMDKRLNKQWAVKEIDKDTKGRNNEIATQSAIAEANMIKKLDHPALPRIVDIIEYDNLIYVIMDYIEGEPLDKIIDRYGAQPQELVIEWAKQLCHVLDYLHTGRPPIIYRDMKPANIMLKPDGNLKLIDFGIAREYKEDNLADTVNLGTKGYAAPEQFGGKGQTDGRTDIYCLGMTLYHLITGQNPCEPPYELYPIRYWNPNLSGGLEKIIQKCTHLNPEDRYQSCTDLLYALEHYEEIDDVYRSKQKKKLGKFILTMSFSFIFFLMGILGMVMKTKIDNADYVVNLQLAERATNYDEKINYYLSAIDIKPTINDAYIGLINTFKEDARFSLEEEEVFKKKINSNLTGLKLSADYADLSFEIGKLYWYYYDYGKDGENDNQITRTKSAIQWFDDAVRFAATDSGYYEMAVIYREIGNFHKYITIKIEEASDMGMYSKYFYSIQELLALIEDKKEENEIVKLELYRLITYSLEVYARKFKMDKITESEMRSLFNTVKDKIELVSTTTEKTEDIKTDVILRLNEVNKAIDNAYMGSVK